MPKNDSAQRLTDATNYLHALSMDVSVQVTQILNNLGRAAKEAIGDEISLEGKWSTWGVLRRTDTPTQRDALRALLLCQRIYMTSLWSNSLGAAPYAGNKTWPEITLSYFRAKPEADIQDALRMYWPTANPTKPGFALAAATRSTDPHDYFTARRGGTRPPVGNSCFDQVSHWLLAAGYVSLRWIMRYRPNGYDYSSFGIGATWIASTAPIPATPFQIPQGMICRLYTDRRPGGHFMVSAGGGWGWGYNNSPMDAGGGEGAVPNGHARCLIHRQFAEYRQNSDRISPTDAGGKLVLLDPDNLPNAC